MKVKFDGKELEVEIFTLYDLGVLEEKGVSIQKISETRIPTAKDCIAVIGYAIRKADPSYKTDEEVAKKIQMNDEKMGEIIKAVLPGGKTQVPFSKKS